MKKYYAVRIKFKFRSHQMNTYYAIYTYVYTFCDTITSSNPSKHTQGDKWKIAKEFFRYGQKGHI